MNQNKDAYTILEKTLTIKVLFLDKQNKQMKKFIKRIRDTENNDQLDVMGVQFQEDCKQFLKEIKKK